MHIVILSDYPDASLGGPQNSIRAQCSALRELGHTVTMVTPPPKSGATNDPDTIFVPGLPYSPFQYPLVMPSKRCERWIIDELAKRPPIDVIHIQTNIGIGMMGIHIARRLKKPLVQTMHTRDDVYMQETIKFPLLTTLPAYFIHKLILGTSPTPVYRQDESLSAYYSWRVMVHHAEQSDIVIVPSRHFAKRLQEHGLTKPIEVISNGINDQLLESIWAELPSSPPKVATPLRAAWVARFSPEKRPMVCLEALKDLPQVMVDFYGEGVEEIKMRSYIHAHGLEERAKIHGRVGQLDVIRQIASHDVIIQSSYQFDNQPMVLIEAAAVGVPAVLSDPDLAENLLPNGCIITKTPDSTGLRDTLFDLASHPEKVDAMRAAVWANRTAVLQSSIVEKLIEAYKKAAMIAKSS